MRGEFGWIITAVVNTTGGTLQHQRTKTRQRDRYTAIKMNLQQYRIYRFSSHDPQRSNTTGRQKPTHPRPPCRASGQHAVCE